jgi:hypothetical protein
MEISAAGIMNGIDFLEELALKDQQSSIRIAEGLDELLKDHIGDSRGPDVAVKRYVFMKALLAATARTVKGNSTHTPRTEALFFDVLVATQRKELFPDTNPSDSQTQGSLPFPPIDL